MGPQMKLTDAEKTRLLAEGVMGWKIHCRNTAHYVLAAQEKTIYDRPQASVNEWDPLHNEAHAAEVRERML